MEIRRIPSFPPYEVSEFGDVYRRLEDGTLRGPLASHTPKCGYATIRFNDKHRTVHSLVAEAFLGPKPDGCVICHNDGGKSNNHYSNLRYDTHTNNELDKVKHGTLKRGEAIHGVRLTETDVRVARMVYDPKNGVTYSRIAAYLGVQHSTVWSAINRKTWAHVT